jgi:DNA replication protein DnaC
MSTDFDWLPHQREALAAMTTALEAGHSGVYLHGPTGSGKTFLADWFAKAHASGMHRRGNEEWPNRVILNCLNATLEAHAAMSKAHGARTAWEMAEECKGASVVLLDDVGRERGEYGRDVIFSLIDQTGGFLIITSNRDRKALVELYGGDEGLASRLSALVAVDFPADAKNLRRAQ